MRKSVALLVLASLMFSLCGCTLKDRLSMKPDSTKQTAGEETGAVTEGTTEATAEAGTGGSQTDPTDSETPAAPETITETEDPAENQTPDPAEDASLKELRQQIVVDGGYIGILFLGTAYGRDADDVFLDAVSNYESWLIVANHDSYQMVEQPGDEMYLLVPANAKYAISVYEQIWGDDTADGMPARGNLLYQAKPGEIVTVKGNQSEIVPNLEVVMDIDGSEFVCYPSLSMENGMLSTGKGIVDLSEIYAQYYRHDW